VSMKKIVVLVGPTAAGKSAFALEVAERIGAEIVAADSMQVYRGMDIGTAKPSREDRDRVPHHLLDVVDPDELFNAGLYQREADRAIECICQKGKVPLIVGGTGLYIKALLRGLFADPVAGKVRTWGERIRDLTALADEPWRRLARVDPQAAASIHPADRVRAQRALEVYEATGTSITVLRSEHRFCGRRYEALMLGLTMERSALYRRIRERVDRMIERGLVDEVKGLLARGYSGDLPSMRGLGYRHMVAYLSGVTELEEAISRYKRDTMRYAKRQLTWFRHQEDPFWYEAPYPLSEIVERARRFLGDNQGVMEGA